MKSCTTCGYWKSDAAFYPDRRAHRKPQSILGSCKDCERAAALARYYARVAAGWRPRTGWHGVARA